MFPLSFGIIRDEFPPERVPTGIGLISATFGIGGGAGLVLSGVIVDHLDYEDLLARADRRLRCDRRRAPVHPRVTGEEPGSDRLDRSRPAVGGLVALLVAVSEGNSWGWGSAGVVSLFVLSAAVLIAWVAYEYRAPEPLVDMRMMRDRAVLTTNLTALLVGFGMFGSFILIPQFVQIPTSAGFGFGVRDRGRALHAPLRGHDARRCPLAGWAGGRIGSKLLLQLGTAIAAAAFVFLALVHDEPWSIYVGTALLGLGVGFFVRLDGEPDRRGGRPAPHGSRDRDQHDHAPDRGIDRRAGRGKHRRRPHSRGDGAARGVRIHCRVRDVGRRGGRGLRARVLDSLVALNRPRSPRAPSRRPRPRPRSTLSRARPRRLLGEQRLAPSSTLIRGS